MYSVSIERSLEAIVHVLKIVDNFLSYLDCYYDWRVSVNAGGIEYGIYLNIDIEKMEIEISNQPSGYEGFNLGEILEMIEEEYGEEE